MKSKRQALLWILFALAVAAAALVWFSPRPLVADPGTGSISRIVYNPYFNQNADGLVEVTGYDAEAVLACLSRYEARRTLNKAQGYWLGDVEIELYIHTGDGSKCILLGNINYSYENYGKPQHRILQADSLRAELLQILAI